MPENTTLQKVFGTIGTVLWSGQVIPQIWKNWRRKSTEGLSPYLMLIWSLSSVFYGVYAIVQDINIPLIVQPQAFGALSAICWIQCIFYGSKRSVPACSLIFLAYVVASTGFQVGFVYLLRFELRRQAPGAKRALQFFGIMSPTLISIGLFPQYMEIYRLKAVKGVSLTFMAIDIFGGVFSLLSLAFKAKWDTVASITYALVIVMDLVIVVSAIVLPWCNFRHQTTAEDEKEDCAEDTSNSELATQPVDT